MDNYHGDGDTHLEEMLAKLENSENRACTETIEGTHSIWTKEDLLDFTDWLHDTYRSWSITQKKTSLYGSGVVLHSIEGRAHNTKATVTLTNYSWYYLLLRGENKRRSEVVEAYLDELFNGSGLLEVDGVKLAVTLDEFAEKYSKQFGGTVLAARKKIERIREHLNHYGYLLNGKSSPYKQIRVKEIGNNSWLQGPRALFLSNALRSSFSTFFDELYKKYPFRVDDSPSQQKYAKILRREMTENFVKSLLLKHGLSIIRTQYMSAISDKARSDLKAIKVLYMKGASFSEIRHFLANREAYWESIENEDGDTNKIQKSVDELINEII